MIRRKPTSRRRHKKKDSKFGAIFMTIFMVVLMVASIASVMLFSPPAAGETQYGDLTFTIDQKQSLYVTELEGKELRFNNLPYQTLSVPTDQDAINLLHTAQAVGITFDPDQPAEGLAFSDFVRFELAQTISTVANGVTSPDPAYPLPLMECANASVVFPIIYLKEAAEPAIRLEGACVMLEGNRSSLLLAKDALLYQYHNIILPEDLKLIPKPDAPEANEATDEVADGS